MTWQNLGEVACIDPARRKNRPGYVEARCNYAVLLGFALGRRGDAIAQLESVLRIRPDFEPARQLLAQLQKSN